MAESHPTIPLDIEALNALATRLRDYVDTIRNPALSRDLETAADVASAMAHFCFEIAAIAHDCTDKIAKSELLTLLGKDG